MAYVRSTFEFITRLHRRGMPTERRSVIELGSNGIYRSVTKEQIDLLLSGMNAISSASPHDFSVKAFYLALGYTDYQSIDADGALGAMAFDLNKDLRSAYGFDRTFDLVTN